MACRYSRHKYSEYSTPMRDPTDDAEHFGAHLKYDLLSI
jgi:hypothetical protein